MGTGNKFTAYTSKPRGPQGGNRIDLADTAEGDKVLQTMRELGHSVMSPAQPSAHEQDFVSAQPQEVTAQQDPHRLIGA